MPSASTAEISKLAYEAFNAGQLRKASAHFDDLLQLCPGDASYHYMQGLVHKYLRDWPVSLRHNLRSQELNKEPDQASQWNAGIAATALGDWAEARRQWANAGIGFPEGEGPIESDFGVASIRLNAWGDGETVYARRLDPVRARLLNVPMPESGYRFGDVVLHDGAATGWRQDGTVRVPVFNAMERVRHSDFLTFSVFVSCEDPDAVAELVDATRPGIGYIEDWTASYKMICRRCSYGVPHDHHETREEKPWQAERSLGIAAQSRASVDRLLASWQGEGRVLEGVDAREFPLSAPDDGEVWWCSPEGDEGASTDSGEE